MKKIIRIATRDSLLALAQAEIVKSAIEKNGYEAQLVPMKTQGDRILDKSLYEIGGKGLFLLELEEALKKGEVDICVHSLKDMPVIMPKDYPLVGVSKREDERDVLVLPMGESTWDRTKPLGCSSRRRTLWIKRTYPEITVENIRGNLNTRLRKLDEGQYGALILAAAGLKRLGMEERINRFFSTGEILPAAGQGVLGIQAKKGDDLSFLDGFLDEKTFSLIKAERSFVASMGGDCTSPVAAYASFEGSKINLTGWFMTDEGRELFGSEKHGDMTPEEIGKALAERIIND